MEIYIVRSLGIFGQVEPEILGIFSTHALAEKWVNEIYRKDNPIKRVGFECHTIDGKVQ